jgi:hypothetical protein
VSAEGCGHAEGPGVISLLRWGSHVSAARAAAVAACKEVGREPGAGEGEATGRGACQRRMGWGWASLACRLAEEGGGERRGCGRDSVSVAKAAAD